MVKIFAAGLMLLDHIGAIFYPNHLWMRMLGRLSMPIFVWYFVQGMQLTSSRKKYFYRLLYFGALAQIPYSYLFSGYNILLGFAYNLALFNYSRDRILLIAFGSLLASFLQLDYGWYLTLTIFVLSRPRLLCRATSLIPWFILNLAALVSFPSYQFLAYFAVYFFPAPIKEARPAKYTRAFYWFYPVHLAVIASISALV